MGLRGKKKANDVENPRRRRRLGDKSQTWKTESKFVQQKGVDSPAKQLSPEKRTCIYRWEGICLRKKKKKSGRGCSSKFSILTLKKELFQQPRENSSGVKGNASGRGADVVTNAYDGLGGETLTQELHGQPVSQIQRQKTTLQNSKSRGQPLN